MNCPICNKKLNEEISLISSCEESNHTVYFSNRDFSYIIRVENLLEIYSVKLHDQPIGCNFYFISYKDKSHIANIDFEQACNLCKRYLKLKTFS